MNWTKKERIEYNKKCADFLGWKNLNDESFPEYINTYGAVSYTHLTLPTIYSV